MSPNQAGSLMGAAEPERHQAVVLKRGNGACQWCSSEEAGRASDASQANVAVLKVTSRTLLEGLQDLLVVKRLGQALDGGQRLAAVALLHAHMDGKALGRVSLLALLGLAGRDWPGSNLVSKRICGGTEPRAWGSRACPTQARVQSPAGGGGELPAAVWRLTRAGDCAAGLCVACAGPTTA